MSRRTGIVVARLHDVLIEQVVGVKLFRSKCFESEVFQNSISPDTDFANAIARRGWETVYIGSLAADQWATFGEHRPTYTFSYTYHKSLREGRRYRYRRSISRLRWHLGRLELSRNPSALVAQIGLAHGIFLNADWDLHDVTHYDEKTLFCVVPKPTTFARWPPFRLLRRQPPKVSVVSIDWAVT
jgi:hypothetical protein